MPPAQYRYDMPTLWREIIKVNQKAAPFTLHPVQLAFCRHAFRYRLVRGVQRLLAKTLVYSTIKKSGKTTFEAIVAIGWAAVHPRTEVLIIANDKEQAQSRVFAV